MKILFATDRSIDIPYTSLRGLNFNEQDLHRIILENLDLTGSSFIRTNLRGAFLAKAILKDCDLSESNLITADLMEANLSNANLQNCKAFFCKMERANIRNGNLKGANGANLKEAKLQGANVNCCDIENVNFEGACYDEDTIWPKYFVPENFGCIKVG
jgi:uncharacterized protein YjbI with pentapeptide repeats